MHGGLAVPIKTAAVAEFENDGLRAESQQRFGKRLRVIDGDSCRRAFKESESFGFVGRQDVH